MKDQKPRISRRTFLKSAGAGLAAAALSPVVRVQAGPGEGQVHGVCFLGGKDCMVTYVDLGPTSSGNTPVFAFPATDSNPLDTGGNYNPFRLQNNVFGGGGRKWPMYIITSANLNLFATTDGSKTIWGEGATVGGTPNRDLTTNPFKSEEEILAARDAGDVVVTFTGVIIDCPITDARAGEIVVNLNPAFPICQRSK